MKLLPDGGLPRRCAYRMINPARPYSWGSHTAIARLTGRGRSRDREAELWIGTHESDPSYVLIDDERINLRALVDWQPEAWLGARLCEQFGPRLPFLLKILAAAQPLSVQAHPNLEQAGLGFRAEELAGIARNAPERTYRDRNHKPELLYAIEPFWALHGFRPLDEARRLTARIHIDDTLDLVDERRLLTSLLAARSPIRRRLGEAVDHCRRIAASEPDSDLYAWVVRLADIYPGDPGALTPLLLHLVQLQPGEALYTEAGVLHSYLDGVGIELQANSDNVVRGGLTNKPVRLGELLEILVDEPGHPEILHGDPEDDFRVLQFPTPAAEFALSAVRLHSGGSVPLDTRDAAEVLLSLECQVEIEAAEGRLALEPGDSAFLPATVGKYELHCSATGSRVEHPAVFRATVPEP